MRIYCEGESFISGETREVGGDIPEDERHGTGEALAVRDMEELVGPMSIGLRPKNPGNNKLGFGEQIPQVIH